MDPVSAASHLMTAQGRQDPYPLYAALRAHGPVLRLGSQLIVTSYEQASAVLRDPRMLVADRDMLRRQLGPAYTARPSQALLTDSVLNTNPPDHRRMRQLVSGAFTPRRVAGLRAAIEAQAARLADRLDSGGPVDLMEEFAVPLPLAVICELLGVPESDRGWFRPVAVDFAGAVEYAATAETATRADRAASELRDYLIGLVADRRRAPTDDLTSQLAAAAAGSALSGAELLGNLALLLLAGHETTTNLIGNGMAVLFDHPAAMARLRAAPDLAPAYVEEFLRFDAPVQVTSRLPAEPMTVGDTEVDGRVEVTVLLGAANHDPDRFAAADTFDPARPDNAPLSFGAGAHFCLGAALARLEARIAFPLLLNRFPRLRPDGLPVRRDRLVLRGYAHLPVCAS
ncbi:cytochrome P450 [Micromonospora sp. CPCC 206061]|uniref:cytochrome P450 n=1 Tax=Micromonospora sp. CPCC 206061 TaxID=3122410 RepID=UPI002FF27028